MLRLSTGIPNCREGRLHPIESVTIEWMVRVAQEAERLGYDGVWTNEFAVTEAGVAKQFEQPGRYFDAMCVLSILAAATERVRLYTATLVLPMHEPLLLAKQAATVDWISGGRLTLGFGLGGSLEQFRRLYGAVAHPNRAEMMEEYLAALRVLWTERRASFAGSWVRFEDAETAPKPIQTPLPVYIAGDADGVFRRIAKFAQGWIDSHSSTAEMETKIATIRGYMEESGRDPAELEIARQVYVAVASSDREAEAIRDRALSEGRYDGVPIAEPPGERVVVGSYATVTDRLRQYVAAGATEVCAVLYARDLEEHLDQIRAFQAEVAPHLS